MKAGIQRMDTGFRRGIPTRLPGESRGLGERGPLDSGFRRNDEGGRNDEGSRTGAGGRRGMTRKYRYDGENLPYGTVLLIFPRGCGLTVEARLR